MVVYCCICKASGNKGFFQLPSGPRRADYLKKNQPVIGEGPAVVQEVMDEYSDRSYVSSRSSKDQRACHEKQPAKLTVAQQQLPPPTEPRPLIAAQHQAKQQKQQAISKGRPTTSLIQQQLELSVNGGPGKLSPPKITQVSRRPFHP